MEFYSFTCRNIPLPGESRAATDSRLAGVQHHLERILALSLSGFTGGFAMKNACAIVLKVKEYFYGLRQISTPLGIA
jgi:hypothetical protein